MGNVIDLEQARLERISARRAERIQVQCLSCWHKWTQSRHPLMSSHGIYCVACGKRSGETRDYVHNVIQTKAAPREASPVRETAAWKPEDR